MPKEEVVQIINILYNSEVEDNRLEINILLLIKMREVVGEDLITKVEYSEELMYNYNTKASQPSNYNYILVESKRNINVASKHLRIHIDQNLPSILSTLEQTLELGI